MGNSQWDRIEQNVVIANTLGELFNLWKEAHRIEEEYQNTFPKRGSKDAWKYPSDVFRSSFCYDGYMCSDKTEGSLYERTRTIVLYIFRESNAIDKSAEGEFNDSFWLSNQLAYKRASDNKYDKRADKYLSWIRSKYPEEIRNSSWKDDSFYKNTAVMNLNKRGGYGKANPTQLKKYVNKYRVFICKEIEIISPTIIICGGTMGHVSDILGEKKYKIYGYKHPAFWGKE